MRLLSMLQRCAVLDKITCLQFYAVGLPAFSHMCAGEWERGVQDAISHTLQPSCIHRAGLLEGHLNRHTWPNGFEDGWSAWLWAKDTMESSIAQHCKNAQNQGIPFEEHIRSVLAVSG